MSANNIKYENCDYWRKRRGGKINGGDFFGGRICKKN